jgi:DNA primase
MGIADDDIVQVRQASDIVAIISEHVQLKRVGRRWQGLCPFHAEKSPSFSVNQDEGLYYCFGCAAKGDVITFVREIEHLDFVGAIEKLAGRAGVTLHYTDKGESEGRKKRKRLLDAVEQAVEWYHQRLLSADDAAKARGYLRSRGFDGEDVRHYRLGWAPEGWDELAKALKLPDQVFVDAGLGFLNRRDRQTDAFRGRLLFPIFDAQGSALGFGGRIMPGSTDPAKYKNSAENEIYKKSKVLYGLHWVKSDIVTADEAIVCEGYTDVIGFAKAGVPRAVATCGTALTEEHVRLLRGFARRVVLAFDADAAGQHAAERFYQWEKAHDVDVAVAALPAGVDPADLARRDPEALRQAVEGAVPFLKFRVDRVLDRADLRTPEGRARAAEAALAVIAEHPSDLVRDQYLMEVASRCRIEPDRLRAGLRPGAAPGKRVAVDRPGQARQVGRETPEMELLRLFVTHAEEMEGWADWVSESLFRDELALAAYRALASSESLREAIERADPAAADLLQRLAVDDTEAEPHDVVFRLIQEAGRRAMQDLNEQARREPDAMAVLAESTWLGQHIDQMNDPDTTVEAAEQLLAWLADRPEENH